MTKWQRAQVVDGRALRPPATPLSVACPRESCQAQVGHRCRLMTAGAGYWRYLKHPHSERKAAVNG